MSRISTTARCSTRQSAWPLTSGAPRRRCCARSWRSTAGVSISAKAARRCLPTAPRCCTSEGGAYNRIEAARAAREYPVILELFEQSAITLTAVRLLAPHLDAANHVAVLASARHQSKRHIEELVVSLRPKPDAREVVRRLPAGRALTLLVESLERRRFAETPRPRASRPAAERSRHVPAAVRREVWRRDGGRCAFVGAEGRCRETAFLEFHHIEPYAIGGGTRLKKTSSSAVARTTSTRRSCSSVLMLVREERACWG